MSKRWPVLSGVLTTAQGERSNPERGYHPGIDIASKQGDKILACDAGTVALVYHDKKNETVYGNRVFINHDDGTQTRYNHLDKIHVSKGDKVDKGDSIGTLGNTGKSTGPHLDFEVVDYQTTEMRSPHVGYEHFIDPLEYLPSRPSWLELSSGVEKYRGRVINITERKLRETDSYEDKRVGPRRKLT